MTPEQKLRRLLDWLVPAWTAEQRVQTVEAVFGVSVIQIPFPATDVVDV